MSKSHVVDTSAGPARLRRSSRKTLAISVDPDGQIDLAAPADSEVEQILAKVAKNAAWIRRQQSDFAAMNGKRTPLRFTSGATHRYLGRQYRLKVKRDKTAGVKLVGAYFVVITREGNEAEVEELLEAWMRERAQEQFRRRVEAWAAWCQREGLPAPRMSLRIMAKRWGSAQRDGRITLNPVLVRAPSLCVDYVVAHEMCHLRHPHHGREFFRELDHVFPTWRLAKKRLESAEL
jgi:predicted metal-dependent hydrolase